MPLSSDKVMCAHSWMILALIQIKTHEPILMIKKEKNLWIKGSCLKFIYLIEKSLSTNVGSS